MHNLAGIPFPDDDIELELKRARIPTEQVERNTGEVCYSLIGRLGPFEFRRAWTYWTVKGPVPIEVAEELYADPVGATDIRVAGHAGCPPPQEWSVWLTPDGKIVAPANRESKDKQLLEYHDPPELRRILEGFAYTDDPASLSASKHVTSYHIDSEVGLRIFVDALRAHDLVNEPATAK